MENSQNGSASVDVGFGCGSVAGRHESFARTTLSPGIINNLYIYIYVYVSLA